MKTPEEIEMQIYLEISHNHAEIVTFVEGVDKNGFRTADDFGTKDADQEPQPASYSILPQWLLRTCADWKEDTLDMGEDYKRGVRRFFKNGGSRTYIDEGPKSKEERRNHAYLPDLTEVAVEYDCRIIDADTTEARKFYLRQVNEAAGNFGKATNPFAEVVFEE